MGGYVFCYDATGSDHDVITDCDTGEDDRSGTDPYIVSDRDRVSILQAFVTIGCVQRMPCRINADIGSDESIVADTDFCTVKYNQIDIRIKVLPYP